MIKPKFTPGDIKKMVQERVNKLDVQIIRQLSIVGEKFIRNARNNDTYKDQTGNLRSSLGFLILKDGKQLVLAFNGDKPKGRSKGIEVANDAAANFPAGYVLICVAGMDYAASVESKNYDVLTASSIIAEKDLKDAIASLKRKL